MFSPRKGEITKDKAGGKGMHNETIYGKYESKKNNPSCDFAFASQPLLKDHDLIEVSDESNDWNFEYKQCFGFVKCVFKLTDGWEGVELTAEDEKPAEPAADAPAADEAAAQGWLNATLA